MAVPTPFNITIDDTTPQIVYTPLITSSVEPVTDLGAGWIPYFNISGFNTFPGEEGNGESLHITSDDGATLTIGFTGEPYFVSSRVKMCSVHPPDRSGSNASVYNRYRPTMSSPSVDPERAA